MAQLVRDERILAEMDLSGVTPTWLWHPYSDGTVEKERLGDWWDAFRHPHWQRSTYWAVVPDEADTHHPADTRHPGDGRCLMSLLGDRMLLTGRREWRDYTITADVRQFHAFNIGPSVNLSYRQDCLNGLVFRVRDVRSTYLYCLENYDRVTLYRIEDDTQVVLGQMFVAIDRGGFHTLTARCRGDRITCLFDGRQIFEAVDDQYPSGWCGLRANSKVWFREVKVTTDEAGRRVFLNTMEGKERELADLRAEVPQPVFDREIPRPLPGPGSLQLRRVEAEDRWGFFWLAGAPNRVAAASMEGDVLWTRDLEGPVEENPAPPSPKAYDIVHDGYDDLLISDANKVKILSGRTGELMAERPFPMAGPLMGVPGRPAPIGYVYAVQFRKPPAPMDILLLDADPGGGRNVWCYDHRLELRWHRMLPFAFGHNMHFVDVDGDGCEEAMLGHCLINGDGALLWSVEEMHYSPYGAMGIHADSVVIGDLEGNGTLRLASVAGDDGVLFVDAATGELLRRDRIGHAQGISAARYVKDEPGIQVLAGTRHRAYGIFVLYNGRGDRLFRWQPDFVNQNGRPVNWRGDGEELLLLRSPDSGHGLFDARGRLVVPFTGELEKAGTVISHPLGEDPRDRLIVLTPDRIALYRQDRPIPDGQDKVYRPVRHYWRGSTIGVISHPGWVDGKA